MDRFEDLQTFVKIVETGSFSAAADQLGLVKSAVSRRVASLEQRLGVQLFRRTTRRLNLSDSGHSFYQRSVRILADLEEAESAVAQAHGVLRGRLRVALPLSFGLRHLEPAITEFSRRHPDLEFDLDLNDRRVDLLEEGFDLALRIGRLEDSSLIARRLFDTHTVVCASPDYLKKHGTPNSPQDLRQHTCLIYSNTPDADQWTWWDSDDKKHTIKVSGVLTVNSGDFLCAAAAAGQGLALQPTFIAYQAIAQGKLVPVLSDYSWPRNTAYAIYPPTRHLSYRVRAFIDFLAEHFAGTPYWDRECERKLKRSHVPSVR